jgi:hypothetical protein
MTLMTFRRFRDFFSTAAAIQGKKVLMTATERALLPN